MDYIHKYLLNILKIKYKNTIFLYSIYIMGHGKTSTSFYFRGVPNTYKDFATVASGNYTVFQPNRPILNTSFFTKSISNFLLVYR